MLLKKVNGSKKDKKAQLLTLVTVAQAHNFYEKQKIKC